MPDKKLTDNEIIQALECCIGDTYGKDCVGCPLYEIDDCQAHLNLATLDTINRQKAEIEQWKEEANRYQTLWCEDVQIARAEAIKEFAERLKVEIEQALESNYKAKAERMAKPNIEMADEFVSYCEGKISALRGIGDFSDNLAKKMVGDKNA